MSLYVIHMDHPTGFCGLIQADHSLFSPRCVPSQLSSLISVEIPCVTICHTHGSSYWILWPNPGSHTHILYSVHGVSLANYLH